MKISQQSRRKQVPSVEESYRKALHKHLSQPSESTLRQAYELGRESQRQGTSLVEMAMLHQKSLLEIMRSLPDPQRAKAESAAGDFLAEILSPFEMAHRGFQDAVAALRGMNETLEEEIKRIAYAVHDEAGQLLVAVHLALSNLARGASPSQKQEFEHVNQMLKQVETQLRQYSHELRPTILDDLGLVPAVRFLAGAVSNRAALVVRVSENVKTRLPAAIEITAYRIVQEALNNAAKHARASSISIEILHDSDLLTCRVQDDGIGFDSRGAQRSRSNKGLGVISMTERVNAIGGVIEIESSPNKGTRVEFRIPTNSIEVKHARSHSARG